MNFEKIIFSFLLCLVLSGFNSKHDLLPENWNSSLRFSYRASSSNEKYYEEFVIAGDSLHYKGNDPDTNTFAIEITQKQVNYLLGILRSYRFDKITPVNLKTSLQSCASFSIQLHSNDKPIIDFSISKNQSLRTVDWNKHNQIISCIYKIVNKKL